ncbi:MAG: PulJ/GspJ family protein [Akkermansiaceae bacterium]
MKNSNHQQKQASTRAGFTLLEIVIALGMMGMLVGMIFRVASSSVQLSQTVIEAQADTMERNAFFNLLKNHFEQIPGNAVMRLETYEGREGIHTRQLFNLTFQNVPMSFNWGETPMTAEAIQLATVQQRDGFVDVVLRFYDVKILEDANANESINDVTEPDAEPVAEIILLEDLWLCDCDVVAGETMESSQLWDDDSSLPLQVKLYCRFDPTADIVQHTFWVTPKENTAVYIRNLIEQAQ